jgi:hypothetical protein
LILQADIGLGSGDARLVRAAAVEALEVAEEAADESGTALAWLYRWIVRLITSAEAVEAFADARERALAAGEPALARIAHGYHIVARLLRGRTEGLDAEAQRLLDAAEGADYDRYLVLWANWMVAYAARDGRRLRELMDLQLANLQISGIRENWLAVFSDAITVIGEGGDFRPRLRGALRQAEAEGRRAEADAVLALIYVAACADEWERAAELLGAVRQALFGDTASFVSHAVLQERVVRPRLDPALFAAACARGEGQELTPILEAHGL